MAYVDWMIKGSKISACNCDYGCPCQFYAPPTQETCEGVDVMEIEEGHFGDTRLDGLRVALLSGWPGAIHEGDGIGQVVIDERADEAQRDALYKILSGKEQDANTAFSIYASTMREDYAVLFKPIEMRCDPEQRTAAVFISGVLEIEAQPIRNSVTGEPHRARILLPHGFEFNECDMASASFAAFGDLKFEHKDRSAGFTTFAYGPQGIVN